MGVAAAPLLTAFLCEGFGWRTAFLVPGLLSMAVGVLWILHCRSTAGRAATAAGIVARKVNSQPAAQWKRVLAIVFFATAVGGFIFRSEEHTSELQSLMRISYAVFCLHTKQP